MHVSVRRQIHCQTSMIRYRLTRHTNCNVSGCRLGAIVVCRIDVVNAWFVEDSWMSMKRRNFNQLLLGAVAGILAGTQARSVVAQEEATEGGEKHVCRGMNECKGQGGCATSARHDCKGQNDCKGQGGCGGGDNGCAGKNSCKGHGGCAVPVPQGHM